MVKKNQPNWEVRVYGTQQPEVDTELLAQIVVMLGRQLMQETLAMDEACLVSSEETEDN